MTEKRIYNSILIDNYIQLVKHKYASVSVDDILTEAGIEPWELDPGNWFTQEQVNRFQRVIVQKTGNPNIAREAGRFSVAERAGNIMRQAALSLLSPTNLYNILGKLAPKYSKAANIYSRQISRNKQEVTVEYKPGVRPEKFQCLNYQGYLEAVYSVFYSRIPRIEHDECYFKEGARCRYIISWDPSIPQIMRPLKLILISTLLLVTVFSFIYKWPFVYSYCLLGMTLLLALISLVYDKKELISIVQKQDFKPYDVMDSHSRFYNSTNLINEIAKSLSRNTSVSEVIYNLSHILISLGYQSGLIIFLDYNKAEPAYKKLFHFGLEGNGFIDDLKNRKVSYSLIDTRLKKPIVKDLETRIPEEILAVLNKYGISPSANIPIVYEKAIKGFLLIDYDRSNSLQASDLHILNAIASQAALSITNISFYDSLLESEALKNNFVTVASHELRTPLQIVMLALEELKFGLNHNDRKSVDQGIQSLEESIGRLHIISKKILDLSRIEKQKNQMRMEQIKTDELAKYARSETDYLIDKYHHEVMYIMDPQAETIYGDLNLLVQVVTNLISNSAKYTPEGGRLAVVIKKTKSGIEISIVDDGIGIPAGEQEKVFLKFYQIESGQTITDSGYGLGLSFCREVIQQHGGYLSIESPLSQASYDIIYKSSKSRQLPGCKVTVHLPAENAVENLG